MNRPEGGRQQEEDNDRAIVEREETTRRYGKEIQTKVRGNGGREGGGERGERGVE